MIEGKTKSGFKYTVNENIKNDWDFLESFSDIQENGYSLLKLKRVLVLMLGNEGFEALKNHVRTLNDGVASIKDIGAEFIEICKDERLKN